MKIGRAAVFSALLLCTCIAYAQAANQNNSFSSTLSGGIHLRAIAGAPFSADVVKESTKTLPDGTQVPVVTRGKMYRDAEGRTRSEIELAATAGPRRYVTIIDPARQVSMVLDQQAKTAAVSPLPASSPEAQPAKMDANRIPAKALAIVGEEDLGTSTLEGFRVTGSRITRLAEETQNMVAESWFSPELKIELQARIAGPRLGEVITKLENIVVGAPDATLFEVPADYAVKTISPAK